MNQELTNREPRVTSLRPFDVITLPDVNGISYIRVQIVNTFPNAVHYLEVSGEFGTTIKLVNISYNELRQRNATLHWGYQPQKPDVYRDESPERDAVTKPMR